MESLLLVIIPFDRRSSWHVSRSWPVGDLFMSKGPAMDRIVDAPSKEFPCVFCDDIQTHLQWAIAHESTHAANIIARNAAIFAAAAFSRERLLEYIR